MDGDRSASVRAWHASRSDGSRHLDAESGHSPLVASVMSRPLVTIPAHASLQHARAVMREHGIHHLLLEDQERIVAIVSDRDVDHALSPWADGPAATRRDDDTLKRPVYSCATFSMYTIRHDAPLEEAAAVLLAHAISALPVVGEDGGIAGIVTMRDMLRELLACRVVTQ
ncbi:MAG: CBS domain-containing protein [Chloroflexi bacterium]|nr:CBS domain-containing protein [Chloroflexota bacterium]